MTRAPAVLLSALAWIGLAPGTVLAQQARLSGSTTLRYIELRPLERDSVAEADVGGSGLLRRLEDGRTVRCVPEEPVCRYTRPGAVVAAVPLLHDIEASAWGFGRGLRAYGRLRARAAWGSGAALWPQADESVDVLAAYAEIVRERFRVRAGRQWQVSGLGFYNFDGLNAGFAPGRSAWTELYVGRSLVRGLNESRAGGALESVEELAPPDEGLLAGVQARYRPSRQVALAAAYQVDFRGDGTGLHSELAALNGSFTVLGAAADAAIELDVATATLNEARLAVRSPPIGAFVLHAEARRYRPYFELWTIWGAFAPVGFDEARAGATWTDSRAGLVLRGEASYRAYGDTGTGEGLDPLRGSGWGVSTSAAWSPHGPWSVEAAGRVEAGFGAARRDGHVALTRQFGATAAASLQALAFQRLYEFRLDEGTVYGLAGDVSVRISERATLFASAAAYQHGSGPAGGVDWNQRRGSLRLQWTVGPEPALSAWRPRPAGGGS